MTGVEIAIGAVCAWMWRKAKRVAGRADQEVDAALDAGADKVHALIAGKLGSDPALEKLEQEAADGQTEPSPRTRQRIELALADATDNDPDFATQLQQLIETLQAAHPQNPATNTTVSNNTFHGPTAFQTGDNNQQTNNFGA